MTEAARKQKIIELLQQAYPEAKILSPMELNALHKRFKSFKVVSVNIAQSDK